MAEFFSGLLRNLILPPGLLFFPVAIGLLLRLRWRRLGNTIAGTALLLLYLACTGVGSNLLVAPLEARTQVLRDPAHTGAQAIVVLSAGSMMEAPEYGGANIPDYIGLGRLRYAAHLQRLTRLPILTSGGVSDDSRMEPSKAEEMAKALKEDFGVPVQWVE
ncbi:MAG: YdcF family protein, partial [Janthinobacterium lividum]